jgi:hypothetical protein
MTFLVEPVPVDKPYDFVDEAKDRLDRLEVLPYERPIESSDGMKSACPLVGLSADTLDF